MRLLSSICVCILVVLTSLGLQPRFEPSSAAAHDLGPALAGASLSAQSDPGSVIGVTINYLQESNGLSVAKASGARWARVQVSWRGSEPSEGTFDWTNMDFRLAKARESGLSVIAVILAIPAWAGEYENGHIVRVSPSKYGAFQEFLRRFAERSVQMGYNIKYYEVLNEVENQDPGYADYISCAYGRYPAQYADLLKVARQGVVSGDPSAKVAFGGLAMEPSARFVDGYADQVFGVIQSRGSNGSEYFDAMNLHLYPYFYISRWSGPAYGSQPGLLGKINYVRGLMLQRGLGDKPVLVTEAGMSVLNPKPDADQQSAYAVRVFVEGAVGGAPAVIWFTLSDNDSPPAEPMGLTDRNFIPRPSYAATKYVGERLGGTTYVGTPPGMEALSGKAFGFSFAGNGSTTHVLWGAWSDYTSADGPVGGDAVVRLPGNYARVTDMYGGWRDVQGQGGFVTLNLSYRPIYVEIMTSPPALPDMPYHVYLPIVQH